MTALLAYFCFVCLQAVLMLLLPRPAVEQVYLYQVSFSFMKVDERVLIEFLLKRKPSNSMVNKHN